MAADVNMLDLCRLCATPGRTRKTKLVDIFTGVGLKHQVADKVNRNLPFKVEENDGLPQKVCPGCMTKLDMCHLFITECIKANDVLQKHDKNNPPSQTLVSNTDIPQNRLQQSTSRKIISKLVHIPSVVSTSNEVQKKILLVRLERLSESVCMNSEKSMVAGDQFQNKNLSSKLEKSCENVQQPSENLNLIEERQQTESDNIQTSEALNSDKRMSLEDDPEDNFSSWQGWRDDDDDDDGMDNEETPKVTPPPTPVVTSAQPPNTPNYYDVSIVAFAPVNKNKDEEGKMNIVLVKPGDYNLLTIGGNIRIVTASHIYHNSTEKSSESYVDVSCFPCKTCCKEFPSKTGVFEHCLKDHPSDHELLNCLECRDIVCGPSEVIREHQEAHKVENEETSDSLVRRFTTHLNESIDLLSTKSTGTTHLASYNDLHKKFILTNIPPKNTYRFESDSVNNENATINVKNVLLECALCDISLSTKEKFVKHMLTIHFGLNEKEIKVFPCTLCDRSFSNKSFLHTHLKEHNPDKDSFVVCEDCGKLILKHKLNGHRDYSHIKRECQYCHQMLLKHAWRSHKEKKGKSNACIAAQNGVQNKYVGARAKLYHCKFCNERFIKKGCAYHYAYHEVFGSCPTSIPQVNLSYLHNKEYQMAFSNAMKMKWGVNKNISNFTAPRDPKECPICHQMYAYKYLSEHIKRHSLIKNLQCDMCPLKFYTKHDLAIHLKDRHLKIGPRCQYCNKYFPRRKLAGHEAYHRGELNFKCQHCPKAFSGLQNLKAHVRAVHIYGLYRKEKKSQAEVEATLATLQPLDSYDTPL